MIPFAARRIAWTLLFLLALAIPGSHVQAVPADPCHGDATHAMLGHDAPCPPDMADTVCCSMASCAAPAALLSVVPHPVSAMSAAILATSVHSGGPGIASPPVPKPPRKA